jgi:hypothetical protein
VGGVNFPPVFNLEGSRYNIKNVAITCGGNRATKHLVKGIEGPIIFTYQNCMCNESAAFQYRHQTNGTSRTQNLTYKFNHRIVNFVVNELKANMADFIFVKKPYDYYVKSFHGRLKNKYERAKIVLVTEGIKRRHFMQNCFLKDDKYSVKEFLRNDGDLIPKVPRGIQYQSGEATLFKMQYTKPVEDKMYEILDQHSLRIFTKGLTGMEVGTLLQQGSDCINDPVYIENDFSAFDASVCVELLQTYHRFVLSFLPKGSRSMLSWAFKFDNRPTGYTSKGVKYSTIGTVTSGCCDTSFKGNFINYLATISIMRACKIPQKAYKFVCNGDDSVLILSRGYLEAFDSSLFLEFGLNAKTVVKYHLADVDYCQSRVVDGPTGPIMVRDPTRIFRRFGWLVRDFGKNGNQNYLKTVLMGEMALNYMVPVLYPMLRKCYKLCKGKINLSLLDSYRADLYSTHKFWRLDNKYTYDEAYDMAFYQAYPDFVPFNVKTYMSKPDTTADMLGYDMMHAIYKLKC